jgi:hypothetical protein
MRLAAAFLFATSIAGCATTSTVRATPATVQAYDAVRSGVQAQAVGGDVRFCAGTGGVLAERTRYRWSDDYLTRYRDWALADQVRAALRYRPALDRGAIDVRVDQGRVILRGHAPSEAVAAQAIARALDVDGVVQVEAWLLTPEAPQPPATGRAEWCPS